jgi:hypothetical protein
LILKTYIALIVGVAGLLPFDGALLLQKDLCHINKNPVRDQLFTLLLLLLLLLMMWLLMMLMHWLLHCSIVKKFAIVSNHVGQQKSILETVVTVDFLALTSLVVVVVVVESNIYY